MWRKCLCKKIWWFATIVENQSGKCLSDLSQQYYRECVRCPVFCQHYNPDKVFFSFYPVSILTKNHHRLSSSRDGVIPGIRILYHEDPSCRLCFNATRILNCDLDVIQVLRNIHKVGNVGILCVSLSFIFCTYLDRSSISVFSKQ